jgi:DNA ligase (NAD+)
VLVKRAGEVIPYIIGPIVDIRTGEERIFIPPTICPVCAMPVESLPDEVAWYCVNNACQAQINRNIEHFVSRTGMDIVGLGIRIVEQLTGEGLINNVADLYGLTVADLLRLEGFAEKKAKNIISAIHDSKNRSLANLITALGIHGIGEVAAEELASRFRDLEELSKVKPADVEKIEGFGPSTAEAVAQWFSLKENIDVIEKLRAYGVWPISKVNKTFQKKTLEGLSFVVTGTLTDFTREGLKGYIKKFGGKVSGSISSKTDYLVLGEDPGSKLEKARSIGVKVIGENEIIKMANAEN